MTDIRAASISPTAPSPDTAPPVADAATRNLRNFTGAGYDKGRSKLWQAIWFAVMNLVFVKWWLPPAARPVILRAFGAEIGERVFIRHRVRVLWPWKLTVGDDCWIGEGAWLLNLEPITIERDVCISQEAFLCTGSHRHHDPAFGYANRPIHISAGAWVATKSVLLAGTTVPAGALIAAGEIVRPHRRRAAPIDSTPPSRTIPTRGHAE